MAFFASFSDLAVFIVSGAWFQILAAFLENLSFAALVNLSSFHSLIVLGLRFIPDFGVSRLLLSNWIGLTRI